MLTNQSLLAGVAIEQPSFSRSSITADIKKDLYCSPERNTPLVLFDMLVSSLNKASDVMLS